MNYVTGSVILPQAGRFRSSWGTDGSRVVSGRQQAGTRRPWWSGNGLLIAAPRAKLTMPRRLPRRLRKASCL